jgi:hypothetical protein
VPGVVLDQGSEGSCVGHGCVGEYIASPARGNLGKYTVVDNAYPGTSQPHLAWPAQPAKIGHDLAVNVYRRAKEIDEWEGIDYDGTSVRAGMLVGRERGWWQSFRWAFNMLELRAALEEGPVVIGVEWTEDAYEAPGGIMQTTGRVVGGHCVLVTGYSPKHLRIRRPAYRIRNSWSAQWGANGSAYLAADDLNRILFQAGGEAAVPFGRQP